MLQFKASSKIKILNIPNRDTINVDKIIYSIRTGTILRISNRYLSLLLAGDIIHLPTKLLHLLLQFEMLVPTWQNEDEAIMDKRVALEKDNNSFKYQDHSIIDDAQILIFASQLKLI